MDPKLGEDLDLDRVLLEASSCTQRLLFRFDNEYEYSEALENLFLHETFPKFISRRLLEFLFQLALDTFTELFEPIKL